MESSFESQPRNPVIAKLFRLAHISENLGYGLRKLKRWKDITGRNMQIEMSINSVKVTFDLKTRGAKKVNVGVKLTETQVKVLELIRQNPSVTHSDIAQNISITIKTAERTTKALRELGILKREGSDKKGLWILSNN